ncbi:MAG: AAA family ATPase, partial [Candidatus Eisenbacteria bacterium]|nr:AAA family ATPase [Candidatus Latescibacterota bacterium]MBD3300952.1 AAA family ATPase [Candidatus Eisenbacteria bacterium]
FRLGADQRDALARALREKVLILTGGPGTGKTTLVERILTIYEMKKHRIALAAPTGRAAKRLAEATRREAKTIHRLLEFSPRAQRFERDDAHPLDTDLLVVDEVSMVDAMLLLHLLRAIPPAARLLLVGDVDQLPSVGPGNVLRDLIGSGVVPVARLEEIFRQEQESRIVTNAHQINRGEIPRLGGPEDAGDFFFVERTEPEEVLAAIEKLVTERIPRRFGLDPLDQIQVLTPMHKGAIGATNLNKALQRLLNPGGKEVTGGSRALRVGDKVMQIRNNYDLEVFNGDIGRILSVDPEEGTILVRIDERTVAYAPADLDELVPAYAVTVHKAQGSEYPCVVLPIHTQHYVLLQRNLLYTAITRGKRLVILVGTKRALAIAVRNSKIDRRYTRLAERLASFPPSGRLS